MAGDTKKLKKNRQYSRKDLYRFLSIQDESANDSSLSWKLYDLLKKKELFRIGYDTYSLVPVERLPEYRPFYTEECQEVREEFERKFKDTDFVFFESVLLNEFLNHQIAQNTIYVEVEKDLSSYAFDFLYERYGSGVMYRPNRKEFDRYWKRNCIVVLDLVSQSPKVKEDEHSIGIEKLLVDVLAEKSIAATFSPAEIPSVFHEAAARYDIDVRKLNRYAGRRSKKDAIRRNLPEDLLNAVK